MSDHDLVPARRSYERCAWGEAFQAFSAVDRERSLGADDLERLAMAAYLVGEDDRYLETLERACKAYRHAGDRRRAARCAFWLGFRLLMRGELGRANGWFARAHRVLEGDARECAERGYLLLPVVEQRLDAGDHERAYAMASRAVDIGDRCGDQDLVACARHQQGRIRLQQGRVADGLALLDETMVAVIAGELSPLVMGLMYCSVIAACQQVYALDRTSEWTAALSRWCEGQPDMVAFVGSCGVHRAEIMQWRGTWPEAIEEARRACTRSRGLNQNAAAAALYEQGDVHRLRGEVVAAEDAYRAASRLGLEPQPGLALLRLEQGRSAAAVTAIRRVASSTADPLRRMRLLPAYVEIALAAGDVDDASRACDELESIARRFDTGVSDAIAAQTRGAVDVADGRAQAALEPLRRAFGVWQRIGAPHAAARVRTLIGLACRELGDEDGAELELAAARVTFERLGAAPDLARVDALMRASRSAREHGLTSRELQVLRLVAGGETNRTIAGKLGLSARTVDRHVSNVFVKLDVSSRAAATAFACRHKLV
jgi:DNA-binding CsgD family transcriptional regulator